MGEGDLKELRELVEFLKASGVAEFDMERPELKVRLTFGSTAGASAQTSPVALDYAQLARLMTAGAAVPAPLPVIPAGAEAAPVHAAVAGPEAVAAAASAAGEGADEEAGLHFVKSPLVGTFYDAPSPGADAFVKLGDKVAAGKVLCIVEAMKIMNEIESDGAGEIVKMYVRPGQPVEYGQRLFGIRP